MEKDKISIDSLPDITCKPHELDIKWMEEQKRALDSLPDDPWNHWDPEDDDNPELDYGPDKYNGKIAPDLSHLTVLDNGKISIDSLPDM